MKEFRVLGHTLSFTDQEEQFYNTITSDTFRKLRNMAYEYNHLLEKDISICLSQKASPEFKLNEIIKIGHKYIDKGIDYILTQLLNHGIYDISASDIVNDYDAYDGWDDIFSPIFKEFKSIDQTVADNAEYRQLRKDSRGRWEGGGFGVGGALKGAVTAGAMNAVGGMAHSLFNFIGNLGSEISASDKKEKIIRKMQELHFDIFQAFDDLTDILEEIYNDEKIIIIPDYRDELIFEREQRQSNIINNIPRIENAEKRKEALVECLKLKPDNTDVYLKIIEYFPCELPAISDLIEFVNIDIYEIKKAVTNTWLPSCEEFSDSVE